MDYEGTDTFRFQEAGTKESVIYSDTRYSINGMEKVEVSWLIQRMENTDIVILEGQKASAYPKIEVVSTSVLPEGKNRARKWRKNETDKNRGCGGACALP